MTQRFWGLLGWNEYICMWEGHGFGGPERILWTKCLFLPKIQMLKPYLQRAGMRGWGLWEVGSWD